MDIQELLKEATKDTLSDENLEKIVEAVDQKAQELVNEQKEKNDLQVEAALAKQDAEYAEKLRTLLEKIDEDHTKKLRFLLESMDRKHTAALQKLLGRYKTKYIEESKEFRNSLVKKIDKYFDIVVEKSIPQKELQEAVENTRSRKLVEEIARMIGIDKVKQTKLVREGIMDAKNQISTLNERVKELESERKEILEEKTDIERAKLLEEKSEGLPKIKKEYLKRVLGSKPIDFINENFDYTLQLFDKEEDSESELIKEEAMKESRVIKENVDRPKKEEVVEESQEVEDPYVEALKGW